MVKKAYIDKNIPNRQTCLDLLSYYTRDQHIINHSKQVCQVALELANNLKGFDMQLNLEAIEAGALLHDICRKETNHSVKGAKLMRELGYDNLSNMIRWHMELPEFLESCINEITLVYLADKKVIDDKLVTITERFTRSLKKNKNHKGMEHIIIARYLQAQRVEKIYEDQCSAAYISRLEEVKNG
jgi:molybdenum cofactor cytidylyltransferase